MMVYPSYRKHGMNSSNSFILGHGYKMMDVTYQLCKELQYDCVTVEAPCEDFIMVFCHLLLDLLVERHL